MTKKQTKKDRRIKLLEEAVDAALALFPEIERWAFGEGGMVTPTLKRKFNEVQKKLERSKAIKITNDVSPEGRARQIEATRKYHASKRASKGDQSCEIPLASIPEREESVEKLETTRNPSRSGTDATQQPSTGVNAMPPFTGAATEEFHISTAPGTVPGEFNTDPKHKLNTDLGVFVESGDDQPVELPEAMHMLKAAIQTLYIQCPASIVDYILKQYELAVSALNTPERESVDLKWVSPKEAVVRPDGKPWHHRWYMVLHRDGFIREAAAHNGMLAYTCMTTNPEYDLIGDEDDIVGCVPSSEYHRTVGLKLKEQARKS